MSSIVSAQNRVEAPFIIIKIGNYTFGHCTLPDRNVMSTMANVTFPKYVQSLSVVKINGSVNTYNAVMEYPITASDDPNLLEKVFSSISKTREVIFQYGDWNIPTFIYKEEKTVLTQLKTQVDVLNSKITYTLSCTSTALTLNAGVHNFNAKTAKPSDVLFDLLKDTSTGLSDIFSGMRNLTKVRDKYLIATDDQEVKLEAKFGISLLEYITYLVNCMVNVNDSPDSAIKKYKYFWAVQDDISNEFGGSYFHVRSVESNCNYNISYNTYEVDVGYPSGNYVTQFSINNDDSWAILYDYAEKIKLPQYSYSIDDKGNVVTTYSPMITASGKYQRTTEADRTWWTQMTQFPLTAVIQIKGLLRPAMLMSYIKVNCYFYGHKHVSSGLYAITKQEDRIDSNGYRTTLTLTRLSGDEEYA